MKKLLAILLSLVVVFGCEDKDKEEHKDCDCHPVAGDMADAGSDDSDMGLDAGAEEDQGGEDAGLDGGLDASGEEAGSDDADCECEGEDCDC